MGADKETRLRRAVDRAQQKLDDLANARDQALKAAMQAWDDRFSQSMHAAQVALETAVESWRKYLVSRSLEENNAIIGQQVVEWRYDFKRHWYFTTGRRGVVEVWDGQEVGGEVYGGIPGRLVVREIRRGKLSIVVDLYCQEWLPAGVCPKDADPIVSESDYAAVDVRLANKKTGRNEGNETAKSK